MPRSSNDNSSESDMNNKYKEAMASLLLGVVIYLVWWWFFGDSMDIKPAIYLYLGGFMGVGLVWINEKREKKHAK